MKQKDDRAVRRTGFAVEHVNPVRFNSMGSGQRDIRSVSHELSFGTIGAVACWLKSKKTILRRKAFIPRSADPIKLRRSKLKDYLPFAAFRNGIIGACNIVCAKVLFSQQRLQLALLSEFCCAVKNMPVIRTSKPR